MGGIGWEGAPAEMDAMGGNVGTTTPYIVDPPSEPPNMFVTAIGEESPLSVNGKRVTCNQDGVAVSCNVAFVGLSTGSAVQCPGNDCGPRLYKGALTSPFSFSTFVSLIIFFTFSTAQAAGKKEIHKKVSKIQAVFFICQVEFREIKIRFILKSRERNAEVRRKKSEVKNNQKQGVRRRTVAHSYILFRTYIKNRPSYIMPHTSYITHHTSHIVHPFLHLHLNPISKITGIAKARYYITFGG